MEWWYFEPSVPRKVAGGIKAQSKRGSFGTTWWGKRWIEVLEGFDIGARLGRGRSYARSGQVLSIDIEPGVVTARVQGSRPTPYKVTIKMDAYKKGKWEKIQETLRNTPFFAARLLAGDMPPDLEHVLSESGLSLFPERSIDLDTDCSCPDWSNPCKHIAAVYYLLAEEFNRDPFLLFLLRGKSRDELLLQTLGAPKKKKNKDISTSKGIISPEPVIPDARFWEEKPLPEDFFSSVRIPPVSATLPRRLGNFPFWRAEKPFLETLETIYKSASPHGLKVFYGPVAD